MDAIPIKIVRVLVFLIICIVVIIGAWCEAFIKATNDILNHKRFKEMIGDVWYWEERGESQNGKYY